MDCPLSNETDLSDADRPLLILDDSRIFLKSNTFFIFFHAADYFLRDLPTVPISTKQKGHFPVSEEPPFYFI